LLTKIPKLSNKKFNRLSQLSQRKKSPLRSPKHPSLKSKVVRSSKRYKIELYQAVVVKEVAVEVVEVTDAVVTVVIVAVNAVIAVAEVVAVVVAAVPKVALKVVRDVAAVVVKDQELQPQSHQLVKARLRF
jgi:hypothetical protein